MFKKTLTSIIALLICLAVMVLTVSATSLSNTSHGYLIASSETISDQLEHILDYNCKLAGIENNFKVGDDLGEALTYLFK